MELYGFAGHYAATARFYFHLREDGDRIDDEEGIELPDLGTARDLAINNARTIIAHEVTARGVVPLYPIIEIADQAGCVAGTVAFRETTSLQ